MKHHHHSDDGRVHCEGVRADYLLCGLAPEGATGGAECTETAAAIYPNGRDIEIPRGSIPGSNARCCNNLPYPAPRCGIYEIKCNDCGVKVALTVAGRVDDPRTITIPCKVKLAS
jgi:hypothetical protein